MYKRTYLLGNCGRGFYVSQERPIIIISMRWLVVAKALQYRGSRVPILRNPPPPPSKNRHSLPINHYQF